MWSSTYSRSEKIFFSNAQLASYYSEYFQVVSNYYFFFGRILEEKFYTEIISDGTNSKQPI